MGVDRIIIGNDHGGYQAKLEIVEHLEESAIEVTDIGCNSEQIVRYPRYARRVASAVARGEFERGILICSTGIGMSIAANKVRGVRASVCTSHYMGKMTRQHNDSNVLCLGGKITGIYELLDIVDAWLDNDYIGGRHEISLGLIRDMEEEPSLDVPPAE
jgi:ribose 5-phosphate isomerase B